MHNPELGQKLKQLEKLLADTEKVAKKYLALTGKCPTELDDDDKVVIPFDDQLYTKLIKLYQEASTVFAKDELAIDACLEKVSEMQKQSSGGGSGVSGKTPNMNLYNQNINNNNNIHNNNINNNSNIINSSSSNINNNNTNINNNANVFNSSTGGQNQKEGGKKRSLSKDPESPAKKKRVTKKGVPPSPSSPVASYTAQVGDLAAARAPNSENWILVRITGYNSKSGRYEVEDDAPDEEEPIAKKFVCPPENIVLLPPDSASIPATAQQPPNSIGSNGPAVYLWYPIAAKTAVLAMFPQTTTFYPAKVYGSHKKNKIVQFYQLQFDDDLEGGSTPFRKVNAQYVIPLPASFQ